MHAAGEPKAAAERMKAITVISSHMMVCRRSPRCRTLTSVANRCTTRLKSSEFHGQTVQRSLDAMTTVRNHNWCCKSASVLLMDRSLHDQACGAMPAWHVTCIPSAPVSATSRKFSCSEQRSVALRCRCMRREASRAAQVQQRSGATTVTAGGRRPKCSAVPEHHKAIQRACQGAWIFRTRTGKPAMDPHAGLHAARSAAA